MKITLDIPEPLYPEGTKVRYRGETMVRTVDKITFEVQIDPKGYVYTPIGSGWRYMLSDPYGGFGNVYEHQLVAADPDAEIHIEEPETEEKKRRAPRPGYVYLVNEINGPHFKIGRTINPDNRIKTFGLELPFEIEYLCLIPSNDPKALEDELHERFKDKRRGGEFFALDADDVAYIMALAEGE